MDRRVSTGLVALTLLDISASTVDAQNWTGAYIGAHGGQRSSDGNLSTGSYTLNNPVDLDPAIAARTEAYSLSSRIGGVQGGYNFQFPGGWVLGVEGDASWGSGDDAKTRTILVDGLAYTLVSQAELNRQATLRARLGFSAGQWLFYATAGVAWVSFEWNETFSRSGVFSTSVSKSETLAGRTVGGGAEFAMTQNWILRAEYLFEDFGSVTVPLAAALPAGTSGKFDLDAQKFRLGINYKF